MFSTEADPLVECFTKVVAAYPRTSLGQDDTSFFSQPLTAESAALPGEDFLERFLALAASRGTSPDPAILAAALEYCRRQPLVTEVMPFRYTVA